MKGGGNIYPNIGVKIDPRAITSARMPESLKVFSGYLRNGCSYLMEVGIMKRTHIEHEDKKIKALLPFHQTRNKFSSSHFCHSDTHLIEFFRTSEFNYKIYAFRIIFYEDISTMFRQ